MHEGTSDDREAAMSSSRPGTSTPISAYHHGGEKGRCSTGSAMFGPTRTPTPNGGRNSSAATGWRSQASVWGAAALEALDRHCGEGMMRSGSIGARPGTARSAAHDEAMAVRMPQRPSTAMDSYGSRRDCILPPLGARRHSPFTHRRSPNVEEFLGDILPPSPSLADDLRPTRANSPPAGTPQDPWKRPVASWAAPSCLPRPPGGRLTQGLHPLTSHYGGRPRSPFRAMSEPAKCAAPSVRPHNAWCTFVDWAPPANGVEDAFLSYELNCREEGSAHAMLLTDIGAEPMMQFNGLEPGRTYHFQVRASNLEGFGPWSDWSAPYVAPTMTEAMKKMEPVTHSAQPFAAVIEWSEPCGQGAQIIGYRVQYGPDPEDLDTLITQSVFSRRTSLVISNLLPNHTYYYRLCAISEVGESDWTDWSEGFATRGMAPDMPDVPKLSRAEPWALHLEWEEPFTCGFEVVQYEVAASTDPSMEKPVFLKSPLQAEAPCSICVTGLEPCTKYYFRLRAQSAMGLSPWSRVSSAYSTIAAVPSVCQTPKVVEVDDDIVALELTIPESNGVPISEFVVRWSEKPCMRSVADEVVFPQQDPSPKAGEKVYCRLRGIAPDLWLHFDCAARNAVGLGQFSEPTKATRTALGLPPPPPPPFVAERTAASLMVELGDVREGRYELRYDFREDFASAELCGMMREALHSTPKRRVYEFPVTNLTNNGPYYFSVRAIAHAGRSHWSPPSAPVMLCGGAPAKMSAPLLVEAQSCSQLLISFIAPANFGTTMGGTIIEYELKYSQDETALQAYKDSADMPANSPPGEVDRCFRNRVSSSESACAERLRVFCKRIPCKGHMMEAQHVEVGDLITGRRYVFQIRALSYNGVGPWSDCSGHFETLSSPPAKPLPPEMAAGFDSPFSLTLRLQLPDPNGKPIEACRLRYFGPSWTHGAKATEWQDWGRPPLNEIEAEDCEVYKVSIDGQKEIVWQHTVLPLAPGAMFRFTWQCRNASGESEWSEPSQVFQTQPSMPEQATPPYIADEEDRTDNSLKLTWDPPFDNGGEIERYTLQWTNNFRLTNFTTIDNILEPTFELKGLQPNQWYYFKVCAYNAVGVGKYSNLDVAKAPDMDRGAICTRAREPGPPSNVKVKAIDRVPGAVHLSWEKPTDDGGSIVTRYKVILSTTPDFEVCSEIVQKASRECKITDIRPDTVYYFDVAAANSVGYGLPSGVAASCRTNAIPPQRFIAPQKPRRPQLQLLPHDGWRSSELQVQWSCPEMFDPHRGFIYDPDKQTHMILYYVVQIRGGTGDATRAEDIQEHEHIPQLRDKRGTPRDVGNTAIFGSLLPGRHYQAFVQSVSAAGNSAWSVASVAVRAPPGVPDIVEPVTVVERTCQSMTIEWHSPGGNGEEVLGFWVRYRTEKILKGWNGGSPLPPESAEEDTGRYEEVKVWETAIYLKLEDCSCQEDEVLSLPASPSMAGSHRESLRGSLESDLKFDLDQVTLGVPCRWKVEGLVPASYYTFEIIAQNVVGASEARLSDAIRSGATPPGPSGCVKGLPEEATTHSVSLTWLPCIYLGGEPLLDFDVAWKAFRFDDRLDPSELNAEDFCKLEDLKHNCVDAETTYLVAEDLRPGDVVVALVRSRNEAGHSSWSRFPVSEELPSLSALPDVPNVLEAPPSLHRDASEDHKPYGLSARWVCPPQNGKWIEYFRLEFTPAVEEHGAERYEMIVRRPADTVWRYGDELQQKCVHAELVPGIAYTLRIAAVSEQGEARAWSATSNEEVAPPDYPAAPKPPTSMWQWPYAIQLDWVEPWMKGAPLESCQALYSLSPHFTDPVEVSEEVANKDLHKHTLIVDGFSAATTVWFRLRVRNSVGWSAWSVVSPGFTTSACKPAPPDMPVVISLESRSLTVGWDPPDSHGAEILDYTVLLVDPPFAEGLQAALVDYDTELQRAINKAIDADGDGDISLEELKLATQREEIQELVQSICDRFDKELDEKLKPRAKMVLPAPANPQEALRCTFPKLLGGIKLAIAVRARNDRGFSEWSEALENLVTPSSVPEPCPALELLEASAKSFLCRYRLPYDCGEPILKLEYKWTHVVGPIQRHLALGGVVETGRNMDVQQAGSGPWELPDPRPASAEPEGYGGSGEGWIEDLSPGTEYDVQVRAENSKGFGQYSKPVRMITLPGKPDRPLRLRHSDKTTAARPPATMASREIPRAASPTPTAMATMAVVPPSFTKPASSSPTRSIHTRAEGTAATMYGLEEPAGASEGDRWPPPGEVHFEEMDEPKAEEPVLVPTVFFSHTARLAVPEVISVAVGDRGSQRSRSPSPGPSPPWQDPSFGIPPPSPPSPERR